MSKIIAAVFLMTFLVGVLTATGIRGVRAQISKKEIVSYSLVSSKLSLHEPVIVNFTIDNVLMEPVTVDLGPDRKEGFRFTVTQPDSISTRLPPLIREGLARIGKVAVEPGQSYTQRLLVNEWFGFSMPGKYVVEVQLANPVRTQKGITITEGTKFRTALEITPRDAEKLRSVCESLFRQIIASKSYEQAAEAALTLSYVKDPVAVPYLKQALASNKMVEIYAIAGLGRIGNEEAVRVLISALQIRKADTAVLARSALSRIEAVTTDPSLKEQIKRAIK
jgi:hypothetical protein